MFCSLEFLEPRLMLSGAPTPIAQAASPADDPAQVVARHLFYNDCWFDGQDAATDARDDAAIAPDKQALLPGQSAGFANYSSYDKGVNGLMIDVLDLAAAPEVDDFVLKVGNDANPAHWATYEGMLSVDVRWGAGIGGSDRVTLTLANGSVLNQWLEVLVLSDRFGGQLGLATDDVFYFGNARADSGDRAQLTNVDAGDELGARNHQHTRYPQPAGLNNVYDYNRDGQVNATDELLARNHQTTYKTRLNLVTMPALQPASARQTLIIDNTDPDQFSTTGPWYSSEASPGYHGENYLHDGNESKGDKTATFTPHITVAGMYDVYARWPEPNAQYYDPHTPITITHAEGTALVEVDQAHTGNRWQRLGTYRFEAGGNGRIVFDTKATTRHVLVDAVKLVSATTTLYPIDDAYARQAAGDEAHADQPQLLVSNDAVDDHQAYLKFDLGPVDSVGQAALRLFTSQAAAEDMLIKVLSSSETSWSADQLTWNQRPSIRDFAYDTVTVPAGQTGWYEFDVTSFAQGEKVAGRDKLTFILQAGYAPEARTAFHAAEATAKPQLVIRPAWPWTYYPAESAARDANTRLMIGDSWGDPAFEARGKAYVALDQYGESIRWDGVAAATHATVRYSVPEGAAAQQLRLEVDNDRDGTFETHLHLTLSDERLYETKLGRLPGSLVRFFDDVLVEVPGGIQEGAAVRLVKADHNTTPLRIDFLELEDAPAAMRQPDATWTVVQQDTGNDRQAIESALFHARYFGHQKVFLPAGNYVIDAYDSFRGIDVSEGVTIAGAGMWHTQLNTTYGGPSHGVFRVSDNTTVRDMKIVSPITQRGHNGSNGAIKLRDRNVTIQGLWTEYISLLFSGGESQAAQIEYNRARNAYKDAMHLSYDAQDNRIESNWIRNAGDDGIAFIAYNSNLMSNNLARGNVVELSYWGRGMTIQGGHASTFEDNLIIDCSQTGIYVMVESYSGKPNAFCTDFLVTGNVSVRCGNGQSSSYPTRGGMGVYGGYDSPMSGRMEHNFILQPLQAGIILWGRVGDAGTDYRVWVTDNAIEEPLYGSSLVGANLHFTANCIYWPNYQF